ncbi:hypothetical protein EJ06DRAFT_480499, partial [Trichodelitschia bisporula]
NHLQNDWAQFLPAAEFAANNAESSTTDVSPFFANYGQNPRIGFEESLGPSDAVAEVNRLVEKMKKLDEHLYESMLISQALHEVSAKRHRRPAENTKSEIWSSSMPSTSAHIDAQRSWTITH